jgi:uncharacterized RDD family membrane protein YckC
MTDAQLQQKRLLAAATDIGILIGIWFVMGLMVAAVVCLGSSRVEFLGTYGVRLAILAMIGVALCYVIGRDVVAGDRSVGKRLMGIRVVTEAGAPIGVMESIKRNSLFAPGLALALVGAVFGLVPIVGCVVGCLLWPLRLAAGLFALGAVIYEIVQITQDPAGVRLGDKMAKTRVIW